MDSIKGILVTTDFSDRSDRAVRRAAVLASAHSAKLILAHVVDGSQPEHLVRAVESLAIAELDATVSSMTKLHAIACSARVVRGNISEEIVGLARDTAVDLVVMGAHRRSLLKDVLTGTTVERVVRAQATPVLVVNADSTADYGSVLVALDFSESSGHALQTARGLGLLTGKRVTMLHIADPSDAVERGAPASAFAAQSVATALKITQALTRFLDAFDLRGVEYSVRVRPEDGPPGAGIRDVAAELDADLVVTGTQGWNRPMRILLGSVTDDLLKTLGVDIVVVPGATP